MLARPALATPLALTTNSEPVRDVVNPSPSTNIHQFGSVHEVAVVEREHLANCAHVNTAAQHLRRYRAVSEGSAQPHVLTLTYGTERVPVYNLTVDDAHEYFANGILVHNCDALRYMVAYKDLANNEPTVGPALY
jgi:hypothetical protein